MKIEVYNELSLESLRFRRWFRHFCITIFKIKMNGKPEYLSALMSSAVRQAYSKRQLYRNILS